MKFATTLLLLSLTVGLVLADLPTSYNFNEQYPACAATIRNQGGCYSAWADNLVDTFASRLCKAYNGSFFQEMSLQQMMDCPKYISGSTSLDSHGCAGAFTDSVLANLNRAAGGFLVAEACNPYVSQFHTYQDWPTRYPRGEGACSERCYSTGDKGSGVPARKYYFNEKTLLTSVEAMKQSLMDNGPLPVGLNLYSSFYNLNYTHHTYDPQPDETLLSSHGALIFGWEDDYWLLQNSWDLTWGHDGHFRAKIGNNLTQIETYFDGATIDATPEVPDFMFTSPREPSVLQKGQQYRVEWVSRIADATVKVELHRDSSSDADWKKDADYYILATGVNSTAGHGSVVVNIPDDLSTSSTYSYYFVVRSGAHTGESERIRAVDMDSAYINDIITPDFGPANNFGARAALFQPHYTKDRVMTVRWSAVGMPSGQVNIAIVKLDGSTVGSSVTVPNTGIYRWTLPSLCSAGQCERSYMLRLYLDSSSIARYSFPFKYYQYSMQWDFAEDIAGSSYRDGDVLSLTSVNTTANAAADVQLWIGAEYPTVFQSAYLNFTNASIVVNTTEMLPTRYASVFMKSAVMGASYVEALPIVLTDAQTVTVATDVATAIHKQTVVFTWTTTGKFFDYVDIILANSSNYEFPILLGLDASMGRFAYRLQGPTVLAAGTYTVTIRNAQNHAVKATASLAITADLCMALPNCGACTATAGCGWCTDSYNGASPSSGYCYHVSADNATALTGYCPIGAMSATCATLDAPTITAVTPATGLKEYYPDAMTVTGTNFLPNTQVTMGGYGDQYAVLNQVFVDSTTITFNARMDSSSNVYVTNPDGQRVSKSVTRASMTCPTGWSYSPSSTTSETGTLAITGAAYTGNLDCQAALYVYSYSTHYTGKQQTLFNFTLFDLAPGDTLTLYNGNGANYPVIATFTNSSTRRTAYCSADYCSLRFLSGSGDRAGHTGFSVDYMTVAMSSKCPPDWGSSSHSASGTTGTIELTAAQYTDYLDCEYIVYKSNLRYYDNIFKLTINHLNTEKDADFVRIYNGQSSSDSQRYPLVATLSGNNITQSTYYVSTLSSDYFTVRFTSNELFAPASTTKGFKITWDVVASSVAAGSAPCPTTVGDLTAAEGELVINQTDLVSFMQCTYTFGPVIKGANVLSFGMAVNGLLDKDTIGFYDGATKLVEYNGHEYPSYTSSASNVKTCTGICTVTINTNEVDQSDYVRGSLRIFWNMASTTADACPLQAGKTLTDREGAITITQQDQANIIDSSSIYCGYTVAPLVKSADEVVVFYVDSMRLYYSLVVYNGPAETDEELVSISSDSAESSPSKPIVATCTATQCYLRFHTYYDIYDGGVVRWATVKKDSLNLFHAPSSAGQTFTAATGSLAVSNEEYVAQMDAYWVVAPAGKTASQMVVFTLDFASIAQGDHLYIYDGPAETAPTILDQYNTIVHMPGYTESSSSAAPITVACSSASCRVRLVANRQRWSTNTVPTGGFSLSWKMEENRCATKRSCGKCLAVPGCSWCQASSAGTAGHCASYLEEYSLQGICGGSDAGWYGSWYNFGTSVCPVPSGPDPAVTSIAPTSTKTGVATPVVIAGSNFRNTTTLAVSICGSSCSAVVFVSETELSCTAPVFTSAAYCEVIVWDEGVQPSDDFYSFTYIGSGPQPGSVTVASVAPSAGSRLGGTHVTISGAGFASGATVKFCDSAATAVSVVSATSITCTTPARSATGICAVTVTNPNGNYGLLSAAFTFTPEGTTTPVPPPSQVGAIVGGVVGGVGGAIIIAIIVIVCCCCRKKKAASGDNYASANRSRPDAAPMTTNPMRSQA